MVNGHLRRSWAWGCVLAALLLGGCATAERAPSTGASPAAGEEKPGPYEGERVVAVVERLERNAHQEWLTDGTVWMSDLVWLAVESPERFDSMLAARVAGHPRIGDRPLLLGDRVSFILPRNWRARDLSLEELEGLQLVR
jgi:hypothetical protein